MKITDSHLRAYDQVTSESELFSKCTRVRDLMEVFSSDDEILVETDILK